MLSSVSCTLPAIVRARAKVSAHVRKEPMAKKKKGQARKKRSAKDDASKKIPRKGSSKEKILKRPKGTRRPKVKQKKGKAAKPVAVKRAAIREESIVAEAPAKPCLPRPQAVVLVRSCGTDDFALSTPLGNIFPDPNQRLQFCQCVADGVPIDKSEVPCGATTTLQQVVDAISCE